MDAASLNVQVEPLESGKVVYAALAPLTAEARARGRLFLRLDIENLESSPVTVKTVTVSFPGSSVSAEEKMVAMNLTSTGSGRTQRWWFQKPEDDVMFDLPGPSTIKLAFDCRGYSDDTEFTFGLAPHVSPVPGGAYLFPARAADLDLGEFWAMNGCTHGIGEEGTQSFAYDMGVWGPNHDDGTYGGLVPGKDGKQNDHHRIWGKPVRAMAAGVVLQALNDCPNNPAPLPLTEDPDVNAKLFDDQRIAYWDGFTNGGSGNHLYVQHGDEVVLYAHMQKGTVGPAPGDTVAPGQTLGLAGNSGNSSAPHLHIHAVQATAPEGGPMRPFVFTDAWAIDNDLVIQDPPRGLWSRVKKQGIPEGHPTVWWQKDAFLWPDKALPEWPELVYRGVAEHDYQALVAARHADGFRPVLIDAYSIVQVQGITNPSTFFNVVFRPSTGLQWEARHGLSRDDFQTEVDEWVVNQGYVLVHIESYFSGMLGRTAYAPVFVKGPAPAIAAYADKTKTEHQSLFDDLTNNQGFVPVNISVVPVNGERRWTALYDKREAGTFDARSSLSLAEYEERFADNAEKGLSLAYVNSYRHGGDLTIVGIWYSAIAEPYVEHHLDPSEFDAVMKKQRKKQRYLRGVTGYQRDGAANFIGIWRGSAPKRPTVTRRPR